MGHYFFKTKNLKRKSDGTIDLAGTVIDDTEKGMLALAKKYDRCLVKLFHAQKVSKSEYERVCRNCLKNLARNFYRPESALLNVGYIKGTGKKGKPVVYYMPVPLQKWTDERDKIVKNFIAQPFTSITDASMASPYMFNGESVVEEIEMGPVIGTIAKCDAEYKGILFQHLDDKGRMQFDYTVKNVIRNRKNKVAVETRRACKNIASSITRGYSVYCVNEL